MSSSSSSAQKEKAPEILKTGKKKNKEEHDFSELVQAQLPINENLALRDNNLAQAIENLLALEKQTRNGNDVPSAVKVARFAISLCVKAKDSKQLVSTIVTLAKRRGQENSVIKGLTQEAMEQLDSFSDVDTKLEIIGTLRAITEGKMFAELERARLTRALAALKEKNGLISEASEILQEIQVETYGSMEKREKIDFILEQVRLCLDSADFIRSSILSRKINTKVLRETELQDLKLRFYEQMIRYHKQEAEYMEMARAFEAMYLTPSIQEDRLKWIPLLQKMIILLCMSKHDNEQKDMMNRLLLDKNLDHLPLFRELLKRMLTLELIDWQNEIFAVYKDSFAPYEDLVKDFWSVLRKRITSHNLRVVAEYYSKINLSRLAELIALSAEKTEEEVAELVDEKIIFAKIDRPAGRISFSKPKSANERLNDWALNISTILDRMEHTCHLIQRETMIHAAASAMTDSSAS